MKESLVTVATITIQNGGVSAEIVLPNDGCAGAKIGVLSDDTPGAVAAVFCIHTSARASELEGVARRAREILTEHENALALKQASGAH